MIFEHIFVINLKRQPKRWKRTEQVLKKAFPNKRVERVDAIDAKVEKIAGVRALSLSFVKVMKKAVSLYSNLNEEKMKQTWIMIAEDDVLAHKNFEQKWSEFKKKIEKLENCPFVYLGASELLKGESHQKRKKLNDVLAPAIVSGTWGAFSILYNAFWIRKFLDFFEKTLRTSPNTPADHVLRNFTSKIRKEKRGDVFVCFPHLFIADVTESNLRKKKTMKAASKSRNWNLSMYDGVPK